LDWKEVVYRVSDLIKPLLPLLERAGYNDTKHLSIKSLYTAKIEYAFLPYQLQWIAEHRLFPVRRSVGSIE
jgi:hypothetical protein